MMFRAAKFEQWMVRLICAIALLFVGLVHETRVIRTSAGTIDVSEYVLPDGSLPIFCITDNDDDGQTRGKMHMVQSTEACQTAVSVLIPTPADIAGHPMQFAATVAVNSPANMFVRPLYPPNTGPRAPPFLTLAA